MLYMCKSHSKHFSSKCKLHTPIFSSAGNFSRHNFCFHAIFNGSSPGSRYKLIFSSLEVIELLPQATAAHITIVKIILTKFYYKTIFTKLNFQENWNYFTLTENVVFCMQLIWIWLTKEKTMLLHFQLHLWCQRKKGKTCYVTWTFATQNSKQRKEKYLQY